MIGESLALLVLCILAIIIYKCVYGNDPPGPISLPIVGLGSYLLYQRIKTGKTLTQKDLFLQLQRDYGDISSFKIGNERFVLLSSYDLIFEAYVMRKEIFCGRPNSCLFESISNGFKGILLSDKLSWKMNRSTTLKAFHSLGIGNQRFSQLAMLEIDELCQRISKSTTEPVSIKEFLFECYYKIMNKIIFGTECDNGEIKEMDRRVSYLAQHDFTSLPLLWKCRNVPLMKFFCTNIGHFETAMSGFQQKVKEKCDMALSEMDNVDDGLETLIGFYVKSGLCREEIVQCCVDLYMAGVDTTASFLSAVFLLLGKYQNFQSLLRQEVVNASRKLGVISSENKQCLQFTQAFIEECHRYFIVVPTFRHRLMKNTVFHGYRLTTNDTIIGEQFSLNFHTGMYFDPHKFDPYRFIDKETGKFRSPSEMIPFSIGKRSCIGEGIAKVEILNTVIQIVSKFNIDLTKETQENYETILCGTSGGIIHGPLRYTVMFTDS